MFDWLGGLRGHVGLARPKGEPKRTLRGRVESIGGGFQRASFDDLGTQLAGSHSNGYIAIVGECM